MLDSAPINSDKRARRTTKASVRAEHRVAAQPLSLAYTRTTARAKGAALPARALSIRVAEPLREQPEPCCPLVISESWHIEHRDGADGKLLRETHCSGHTGPQAWV
jgi:hypothetical protein